VTLASIRAAVRTLEMGKSIADDVTWSKEVIEVQVDIIDGENCKPIYNSRAGLAFE
jgi:hypothetical protein